MARKKAAAKKATPSKKKAKKTKKVRHYLINVVLRSPFRSGAPAYRKIFADLYNERVIATIQSDKQMLLRTQFTGEWRGNMYLYGKISKFTKLDGKDWINIESREVESVDIPKNRFPNLKETDYVFIPSVHKLAIVNSNEVSLASVIPYLKHAFASVVSPDESVEIRIIQSSNIFEEIYNAKFVEKLEITVSYSNQDILPEAAAYMDNLLRNSGIGEMNVELRADHNNNIVIENNPVIKGSMELAQNNGSVKARIVDENDHKRNIFTEDHPQQFIDEYPEDGNRNDAIVKTVINEFGQTQSSGSSE